MSRESEAQKKTRHSKPKSSAENGGFAYNLSALEGAEKAKRRKRHHIPIAKQDMAAERIKFMRVRN